MYYLKIYSDNVRASKDVNSVTHLSIMAVL